MLQLSSLEGFSGVAAGTLPESSWAGAQRVDSFYMAQTEITGAEFLTVRTWAAANGYDIGSAGAAMGANSPVTNVSWYQTLKWCNARSEREGLRPVYKLGHAIYRTGDYVPTIDTTANGYRLPSEKEWEFAGRGGVETNGYEYSGSNDIEAVAWCWERGPKEVAAKQANELGLWDMSGNVWEWCFDAADITGIFRVLRGGSWNDSAFSCRVAGRHYLGNPLDLGNSCLGFRVARSSVSQEMEGAENRETEEPNNELDEHCPF
jgi:formylglycine-generating enzyme required for sulfatase activity